MIPTQHAMGSSATDALAKALGRPVSDQEVLTTDDAIVAHWQHLGFYADKDRSWTSVDWARHVGDPNRLHPFAADPTGDDRVILHVSVRLNPKDRKLTPMEWSEIGHRLARVTGIAPPGSIDSCRWIAVRGQDHRLDLLANLIREDGVRATPPPQVLRKVVAECRRIEFDLRLLPPGDHGAGVRRNMVLVERDTEEPDPRIATHWTDEAIRYFDAGRRLVEEAAHQLHISPSAGPELAHQLEWLARRSHTLEADLAALVPGRPHATSGATRPLTPVAPPAGPAARSRWSR